MHVERRADCVDLSPDPFPHRHRVVNLDHHLQTVPSDLVGKSLNVIEVELGHVDCVVHIPGLAVPLRLSRKLEELGATLFLFKQRVAHQKEFKLQVAPLDRRIIFSHSKCVSDNTYTSLPFRNS